MNPQPPRLGLKGLLLTGLAAILPALLIVLIIVKGFELVHSMGGSHVAEFLFSGHPNPLPLWMQVAADLTALLLLVALVLVTGLLVQHVFGRQLLEVAERALLSLPGMRHVYPGLRQLTDFLVSQKRPAEFQRVVAVPYPHPGVYAIGFVTGSGLPALEAVTGRPMLTVFIPSSPLPFTGWICLTPQDQAIPLPMTVEEALGVFVSAGVSKPVGGTLP